jgi:hypothetical protein
VFMAFECRSRKELQLFDGMLDAAGFVWYVLEADPWLRGSPSTASPVLMWLQLRV